MYNSKNEPNVSYGLWVIMMVNIVILNQVQQMYYLVRDIDRGGYTHVVEKRGV